MPFLEKGGSQFVNDEKEKIKNRYNLRITDLAVSKKIRELSKTIDRPINSILNEILKFGLPVYLKSLTISSGEELNPAENQNYETILKKLDLMRKKGDSVLDQLGDIIEKQAVLAANLEVTKFIISSIYSRQKVREAEDPNLRAFSEAEEQMFDTRIPSQFENQLREFIMQLFSEEE